MKIGSVRFQCKACSNWYRVPASQLPEGDLTAPQLKAWLDQALAGGCPGCGHRVVDILIGGPETGAS